MRFLLVTMRNLMVNVNFNFPPTMRESLGLTVRILLVTKKNLLVKLLLVTKRNFLVTRRSFAKKLT